MGRRLFLVALAVPLLTAAPAVPQNRPRPAPRLEAIAETKLLMQGINLPNFQALQKSLKQRPADVDGWTFARGQALLVAECGNLLLLRPPRGSGQEAWMGQAMELRVAATKLARSAAARDYDACRTGLVDLTNACNQCHQTFRVNVALAPFAE
jgi:hypothetical protein